MADKNELSEEEKAKAAELEAEAGKEKSALENIGDELKEVTDLLKSHVEKKTEPEEDAEPKEEPIDFEKLDPAELAKSFGEDKNKAKEFISKLASESGLAPQDMLDTEGKPYIDEDMLKSLEEAEAQGNRYLAGILYAMQENNERAAKVTATTMHTMMTLAKSVSDLKLVIEDMQKSTTEDKVEDDPEGDDKAETELPTLDADDPISDLNPKASLEKSITKTGLEEALRKSFFSTSYQPAEQEQKYHKYMDFLDVMSPENVLAKMDEADRDLVQAELNLPI